MHRVMRCVVILVAVWNHFSVGQLHGPHVCSSENQFTTKSYVTAEPYTFQGCSFDSSDCTESKIIHPPIIKTQVQVKTQLVENCCPGYVKNKTGNGCEPFCSTPCGSGICVAPNRCLEECPLGFWGYHCENRCNCVQNNSCHPIDGKCQCPPGYTGYDCNEKCPTNTYGQNCKRRCDCLYGYCDHVTGCICLPGYTGEFCSDPCHNISGKCQCLRGYTGHDCNEECPSNTYGQNCKESCDCLYGDCDNVMGCICYPGYIGEFCSEPCPNGTYGHMCSERCTCQNGANCRIDDGKCTCQPGWTGLTCAEECPAGFWGANCTNKCDCDNNASCHHINGKCTCGPGYVGIRCETRCLNGSLDKEGMCRCKRGWTGVTCDKICECGTTAGSCHPDKHCSRMSVTSEKVNNPWKKLTGIFIGVVLFILLSGMIIVMLYRRKVVHKKLDNGNVEHLNSSFSTFSFRDNPLYYTKNDTEPLLNSGCTHNPPDSLHNNRHVYSEIYDKPVISSVYEQLDFMRPSNPLRSHYSNIHVPNSEQTATSATNPKSWSPSPRVHGHDHIK